MHSVGLVFAFTGQKPVTTPNGCIQECLTRRNIDSEACYVMCYLLGDKQNATRYQDFAIIKVFGGFIPL